MVPIPPGLWFPKERKTVVLEREIEQHVQAWNRWCALTLDLSFEDFEDYRSMVEMISSVGWFQFVPILTGASALIPRSLHPCRLLWAGVLIWSMLIFHHHLHHKFGRLGCDCVGVDGLARTSREWSPNTTKVLGAWCLSPCCGMKKDHHGWTCFNMFLGSLRFFFGSCDGHLSFWGRNHSDLGEALQRGRGERSSGCGPFLEASCDKLILSASG